MSRFTKPDPEKVSKFINESDAQLAYRLQNEEFTTYYDNGQVRPQPQDRVPATKPGRSKNSSQQNSPRQQHPQLGPRTSAETNFDNIDSPNAKIYTSETEASNDLQNDQIDKDMLLAQKLQKREEEKYQRHLEKRKKRQQEKDQEKQTRQLADAANVPSSTQSQGVNQLNNPLFHYAEQKQKDQRPNQSNIEGFANHQPSTSTKIPGHEHHKHTEIGELTRPLPTPKSNDKTITPASSASPNETLKEDELLALKLHRAEILAANKHIKSDKNQIIQRIRDDRKNEQKRQQRGGTTTFRGSPSAVSLEDEEERPGVVHYPHQNEV